jgi:hypothetical protein
MESKDILNQYMELLLTDKEALRSVLAFCKKIKLKEKDFYEHFSNLESLDKAIWVQIFNETKQGLLKEKGYINGTSREKVLFFYFTNVEVLKSYRSYILFKRGKSNPIKATREIADLSDFKEHFENWIKEVIDSGVESEEIVQRQMLVDQYFRIFWGHFLFILEFWITDNSKGFEKTDAAIEKSVNLGFELIGKSPIDSAIDFAKFLFQNKKS